MNQSQIISAICALVCIFFAFRPLFPLRHLWDNVPPLRRFGGILLVGFVAIGIGWGLDFYIGVGIYTILVGIMILLHFPKAKRDGDDKAKSSRLLAALCLDGVVFMIAASVLLLR